MKSSSFGEYARLVGFVAQEPDVRDACPFGNVDYFDNIAVRQS
jgi:hypothetical protein